MPNELEIPEFTPREEKIGSDWYVLVTWSDGYEQQVPGFKSEAEADQWIKLDSFEWLQRHPKSRPA